MRTTTILLLAGLLLSGCFGLSAEEAARGQVVQVVANITDSATGQRIAMEEFVWKVGASPTGLGPRLEQAVAGLPVNATFAFDLAGEDRLQPNVFIPVPRRLPSHPLNLTLSSQECNCDPLSLSRNQTYSWPAPLLDVPWSLLPRYPVQVIDASRAQVTIRFVDVVDRTDAIREAAEAFLVHAWTDGEEIRRELDARIGTGFLASRGATPDNPAILGLTAGAYVIRDVTPTHVIVGWNPDVHAPVLGRDVRVEGIVRAVFEPAWLPIEGNYGVRDGRILEAPPLRPVPTPELTHDHSTHTH